MKSPGKYSNSEAGQQEKCTIQTNGAVCFVSRLLVTFVGKNEKFLEEIVGHQGECAILENIFWGRRSFWSKRDFSEMYEMYKFAISLFVQGKTLFCIDFFFK